MHTHFLALFLLVTTYYSLFTSNFSFAGRTIEAVATNKDAKKKISNTVVKEDVNSEWTSITFDIKSTPNASADESPSQITISQEENAGLINIMFGQIDITYSPAHAPGRENNGQPGCLFSMFWQDGEFSRSFYLGHSTPTTAEDELGIKYNFDPANFRITPAMVPQVEEEKTTNPDHTPSKKSSNGSPGSIQNLDTLAMLPEIESWLRRLDQLSDPNKRWHKLTVAELLKFVTSTHFGQNPEDISISPEQRTHLTATPSSHLRTMTRTPALPDSPEPPPAMTSALAPLQMSFILKGADAARTEVSMTLTPHPCTTHRSSPSRSHFTLTLNEIDSNEVHPQRIIAPVMGFHAHNEMKLSPILASPLTSATTSPELFPFPVAPSAVVSVPPPSQPTVEIIPPPNLLQNNEAAGCGCGGGKCIIL